MAPDGLRRLSLRMFQATVLCAIVGIVVILAVPSPGFRAAVGPAARFIAMGGLALLGVAALANLVSLVTGAIAWTKGAQRCPWIFVCALALVAPVGLWVAASLGL